MNATENLDMRITNATIWNGGESLENRPPALHLGGHASSRAGRR